MGIKKIGFAFLAASLIFAVGCKKKEQTVAIEEIVIGGQNPETGQLANYGASTVAGASLAFDEINEKGGVNGKKIKFLHYDSRGDKTEAVNLTKRLLNSNVCAIIGEITSGAFFSMRDTANRGQTVAISTGATAGGATVDNNGKNIPFAFRNTLQDSDGANALVEYIIKEKGLKKFGLITSANNDYSVGLSGFFRDSVNKNGGTIVVEQSIADGDTDVSAQITSLRGKGFDVLIFSGYYQEASLLLLEMVKQGIKVPLIGGDGFQSPELWNVAKDASVGTIFFSAFAPNADISNIQDFKRKIEARGAVADSFSAHGYDAAYLLAKAVADAGVTNCADATQRDKLRVALGDIKNFEGVSGTMSFDETGTAVKKPFILEVVKTKDGFDAKSVMK